MINRSKFALTFGIFGALIHLVWSVLVALGLAQPVMNFVYGMHFMANPYMVAPFSIGTAVGLIALGFVVPYIISSVFATIWNKVHKNG